MDNLKTTPLNAEHRALGAKMVDFGGWDMPVQYTSIIDEHMAVRTKAGLFDVSHMGEIWVEGPQALNLVQFLSSNDASKLALHQIQYSGLLTPEGCFVDDMLVHKDADDRFLLVVNASNTDKDYAWILSQAAGFDAKVFVVGWCLGMASDLVNVVGRLGVCAILFSLSLLVATFLRQMLGRPRALAQFFLCLGLVLVVHAAWYAAAGWFEERPVAVGRVMMAAGLDALYSAILAPYAIWLLSKFHGPLRLAAE